jgi:hypothetical protein
MAASKEASEIESKRLNVVVYGLAPSPDKNDKELLKDIFSQAGLDGEAVVDVWRDGPQPKAASDYRFCKVSLSSMHSKAEVLRLARMKKFGGLYIRRDLTYNERVARRKAAALREKAPGAATTGVTPRMNVTVNQHGLESPGGSSFGGHVSHA